MANKQLKRWLPSTGQLPVRAERSTRSQTHRTRALPAGVTLAQLPETAGQLLREAKVMPSKLHPYVITVDQPVRV